MILCCFSRPARVTISEREREREREKIKRVSLFLNARGCAVFPANAPARIATRIERESDFSLAFFDLFLECFFGLFLARGSIGSKRA